MERSKLLQRSIQQRLATVRFFKRHSGHGISRRMQAVCAKELPFSAQRQKHLRLIWF